MFFLVIGITFLTFFLLEITHKEYISIQLNSSCYTHRKRFRLLHGGAYQAFLTDTFGLCNSAQPNNARRCTHFFHSGTCKALCDLNTLCSCRILVQHILRTDRFYPSCWRNPDKASYDTQGGIVLLTLRCSRSTGVRMDNPILCTFPTGTSRNV